jgi:putative flippase GtrA
VDLVAASRFRGEGGVGDFGPFRRLLSSVSTRAAGLCFPRRLRAVSDPMSGFFLVRTAALDLDRLQPEGFKILLEILVRTPDLRTSEVPFEFGTRHAGESKAGPREAARYLVQLWRLRLAEVTTRVGRFGLVGATGLAVNTVALAVLADVVGVYYVLAAVLATQVSTLWNFAFTELWVFADREHRRRGVRRMAMFFVVNNAALGLRIPVLVGLTAGLGLHYVASNLVSLGLVFVLRFTVADLWIWAKADELAKEGAGHNYDLHGLVTVASEVRLPELERFRVGGLAEEPDIRVRLGRVSANGNGRVGTAIRYCEGPGGLGFGLTIEMGETIEATASPLVGRSPHVLYTNVVEPCCAGCSSSAASP